MKPALEPVVWSPPPVRPLPKASPLPPIHRIELPARGEDVAVDAEGRLIAGLEDGRIVRVEPHGAGLEALVSTGGRPLGIEVAPDGTLVVCDATRGLLRVWPTERRVEVLVDAQASGLGLCNNAALARDGSIYFSDSSQRFGLAHWRADLVEHSGTGRLYRRAPDGSLERLADGLQFANGVALAPDESFVVVAESGAYRLTRVWLTGSRRGTRETWCELPGFPDNLSSDAEGRIWVALASPRNPLLDALHRRRPLLRKLIWALPEALQPQPSRTTCVLSIDASGRIDDVLRGESPRFHLITGVRARGEALYVASLAEAALGVIVR